MAPLRFGIVGTGYIAQTVAGAMRHVEGIAIGGFCSRDPARAAAIAAGFGARGYGDLAEMLADPAIGAIYVANDSAAHAATAIAALGTGKPVLCEKPCALSVAEAGAILAAAETNATLFMEAVATPFLPAVAEALRMARASALGALSLLEASFGYPATAASHPGCFAPVGGGVLLDRAVYPVTLALLAMGPVERVEASVTREAAGIDVDAAILLRHRGGGVSLLAASLTAELGNRMTIAGSAGTASVTAPLLTAEALTVTHPGEPVRASAPRGDIGARLRGSALARRAARIVAARRVRHLPYGPSPYVHELRHFADLVRAGATASPVLPPVLSAEVMAVIDLARASA